MPSILKVREAHDLEQSKVHAGRAAQEHVRVGVVGPDQARDASASAKVNPVRSIFSTGVDGQHEVQHLVEGVGVVHVELAAEDDPAVGKVGDGLELL